MFEIVFIERFFRLRPRASVSPGCWTSSPVRASVTVCCLDERAVVGDNRRALSSRPIDKDGSPYGWMGYAKVVASFGKAEKSVIAQSQVIRLMIAIAVERPHTSDHGTGSRGSATVRSTTSRC